MKKIITLGLLSSTLAFAQAGMLGGSEGLHEINAKTLGQWQVNFGASGNLTIGSWGLSRGGIYEVNGKRYAFNDADASLSGNIFVEVGVLDFIDVGMSLPLYYEHANSKWGGTANMWTTSRGDLDVFAKIGLPFASAGVYSMALMLDLYVPTGEECAGVRPRHAWYLNGNGYTHPFTADRWTFGAGLAFTFDFNKIGAPIVWNLAASYVSPASYSLTQTFVYSTGLNWNATSWMTPFLEFSGEMRLMDNGRYSFDPLVDPMLITPGVRFHFPHDIDFAFGMDFAARLFQSGFDHYADVKYGRDHIIYYQGQRGVKASYGYTSVPLLSGSALLSVKFDAAPKSEDSDGDGIPDNEDKCARTEKGVKVDAEGCPVEDAAKLARERAIADSLARVDSDNDGIPNVSDRCPNTAAGLSVDSTGCMLDFDKDGVADNLDKCPNTPAGIPVDFTGCPMDHDKDGVADYLDKCPNTQRGAEVGPNGCVLDSDNDGIADFKDMCPGTPAGHAVDSTGCLPDFDKDGVADVIDKCPNTLPGIRVDGEGCPVNKKEDLDQLKKGIQFKTGSAKLTKKSYGTLNDIADLMNRIPEANLEVQGHTDNKGSDVKNQKLSESRAQAVVAYLEKRGVNSSRLRAVGYGPSKPIADNGDAAGRAQNRRVELVPFAK